MKCRKGRKFITRGDDVLKKFMYICMILIIVFGLNGCIFTPKKYVLPEKRIFFTSLESESNYGKYSAKYGDNVFYLTDNGIRCYNDSTGSDILIYKTNDISAITANDEYVFFLKNSVIYQITHSGDFIGDSVKFSWELTNLIVAVSDYVFVFGEGGRVDSLLCSDISAYPQYRNREYHSGVTKIDDDYAYELEPLKDGYSLCHKYISEYTSLIGIMHETEFVCSGFGFDIYFLEDNQIIYSYYDNSSGRSYWRSNNGMEVLRTDGSGNVISTLRNRSLYFVVQDMDESYSDGSKKILNHKSDQFFVLNLDTAECSQIIETDSKRYIVGVIYDEYLTYHHGQLSAGKITDSTIYKIASHMEFDGDIYVSVQGKWIFVHGADKDGVRLLLKVVR